LFKFFRCDFDIYKAIFKFDVIDWLFKKCFKRSKSDYWSTEREREKGERGGERGGGRGRFVCVWGMSYQKQRQWSVGVVVYANSVCDAHRVPWCNSINNEKTKKKGGESGSGVLVAVMYAKSIRDARRVPKSNSIHVYFCPYKKM
jgi:hypothetical protein